MAKNEILIESFFFQAAFFSPMVQSVLRKYLKKYMWFILLSIIFSVAHNYLELQLPLMLDTIVDDIIIAQQWGKIGDIILFLMGVFLFSGIFGMLRTFVVQYIGTNVVFEIRDDMYRALQSHSFRFYDQNRTGDLMSKTTHDVNITRNFLAQDFANFIRDIITLLIILIMVFNINVLMSLIFLSLVPAIFYLVIWYRKRMYPAYLDMSRKNGTLTAFLQENITGVRVVKSFAREEEELDRFDNNNNTYLASAIKVNKISTTFGPLQELITMGGSITLLVVGGFLVLGGELNLGAAVSFFAFFAFLYNPIKNMALIYSRYSQVEAGMARINSILSYQDEIKEIDNPIILPEMKGEFDFKNVWFCYKDAKCPEDYVLKNINLHVAPGERIAILGATGSGKTSFINLIPRFYDVSQGAIFVDGIDIRTLKLDEYRRQIGVVSQDIFLFSRSIRDNIAFGNKKINQEQIEAVAKIAAIHNFIISLPDGYKTMVGERGQTLSGGQKQRIAIARALLLDPKILIFDDSLSAVDIDTEVQIQQALEQLYQNRTTFVITQRISTIQNCDRILVLERGEIVELGSHTELYAKGGIYTKIYNTMYKTQTEAPPTGKETVKPPEITGEPTLYASLSEEDAQIVEKFYEDKYPEEERRRKAEEKAVKRIEKDGGTIE
jgi:ABC-type multidrug transport system fused ATPase/permease subunit